jgi:hypothetical protein
LTREQKADYQYQLYLNGHEGDEKNGAYSSSFKWALMCRSLVFYSAPSPYLEFWFHCLIFREGEHFVYTKSPQELEERYKYYRSHPEESVKIADNAFTFFRDYLLDQDMIVYYMQRLLTSYAQRLDYVVTLSEKDVWIKSRMSNPFLDNINESKTI